MRHGGAPCSRPSSKVDDSATLWRPVQSDGFHHADEVLHWWKNVSIFGFKIWPGMYQIFVLIILMINNFQLSKLHTLDMYQIS